MAELIITLAMPSSDEVWGLALLMKRIDYDTCQRFASKNMFYGGRSEADVMWSAICALQRQLAEAGFAPR